ncbi:MAG TPA: 50S ribosomal protein L24 [Candidatus Saccharimonadales bacterium]|nr:50S ribosomal protein L24 [Candidatus Saccharimonadales bacterium]
MAKAHIKKGDEVVVIAGSELGKRGKVLLVNKKNNRVLLEGIKMIKRHTRKSEKHPQGAIVEREGTIHLSNVTLAERFDASSKRKAKPAEEAAKA